MSSVFSIRPSLLNHTAPRVSKETKTSYWSIANTLISCLLLGSLSASAQQIARSAPTMRPQVMDSYGKLPLNFEANQGQTDQRVKFLARGPGYTLFLTSDSAVLALRKSTSSGAVEAAKHKYPASAFRTSASYERTPAANAVLKMKLVGANAHATVAGTEELPGKSNYFVGNDPKQWRTNVPTYAAVKYAAVYPGIDLVYHGNQRLLEYDFVVAPGADPRAIDLRFQGARRLSVNREGALVIGLGGSEVVEHAPVVYQEIGGVRKTVAGRYVLRSRGQVGFRLAEYDKNQPLVIDPTLVYSTYLGAGAGMGIAVDASGSAYVTGSAASYNFPTTPGAYQTTSGGGSAFVSKLNAAGSALVYSTYLGENATVGHSIAIDASGNAYVTGVTNSSSFPTTPGTFQPHGGGSADAFLSKLNASGVALVYSTYLGGSAHDEAFGIAVDAVGNAYVTGVTNSTDFPTTPGAFQTSSGGRYTFVSKLNASGSALVYSTYSSGGCSSLGASCIAVDAAGNAYVTGVTGSTTFPTTPGAFQTTLRGIENAFVSKLNAAGSALVYSTYLGSYEDIATGIALDASCNAYIIGYTWSTNFPTTPGAFQTTYGGNGNTVVFVSKLNAAGSDLVYSTYLGTGYTLGGIAVDTLGSAYVTGETYSSTFPTTTDAFQTAFRGATVGAMTFADAFVTKLNAAGSALIYSSYLGGSGNDVGFALAVDGAGNAYITGETSSYDFPTTADAFQTTSGGIFVSKLGLGTSVTIGPVTTATFNGPAGNNGWYLGPVTVTLVATAGSSPVSATYYSLDGGQYQSYGAPFSILGDGVHQLLFYSVDTAGHQETPHGQTIKIDATKPVSHIAALPATASSPNFSVQWSGTDATSGLRDYTIYISDNSGPFAPWLSQTTATQAWFAGFLGHTYRFYSAARDVAGNVEVKNVADATTQVPAQMPADVNGDHKIDCADITIVKASLGKAGGQTGFDFRADVNHDGVVDVRDLAIVTQKLVPGTKCP